MTTENTLKALLDHQARMQEVASQIGVIDATITDQRSRGLGFGEVANAMVMADKLKARRQDLAAAVALGQITDAERIDRQAELDGAQAELDAGAQSAGKLEEAVAGLTARRDALAEQLDELRGETKAMIAAFISDEAEQAGIEYVNAAEKLHGVFMRLLSLNELSAQHGGRKFRRMDWHRFFVPSFTVAACMDIVHPNSSERLFDHRSSRQDPGARDGYEAAFRQESARLRKLGITLI